MPSPTAKILGAYRLTATAELLAQALESKYAGLAQTVSERRVAEERVSAEISSAVLIEVLVTGRDEHFDMRGFGQHGSDQAPYGEVFLSADGAKVVSESFDVPDGSTLRLAFYLHFVDPVKPLKTCYGDVALPAIEDMPTRLSVLVPYEPVT